MLKLDWCSHEAATYAVTHWHYSQRMPIGRMVRVGVWEHDEFIGVVLFARGNSPHLGTRYSLTQTECCELVRVALTKHEAPVTRIVSIALKMLRKSNPGIKLVVSFADPAQGHVGGIYQAGNWIYVGETAPTPEFFHEGRWKHNREVSGGAFGQQRKIESSKHLPKRIKPPKHKYLYPLDDETRSTLQALRLPYPNASIAQQQSDS